MLPDCSPSPVRRVYFRLLFLLPPLACCVFLPPLAEAFRVKNHLLSLGGLLAAALWLAAPTARRPLPFVARLALALLLASIIVSNLFAGQPTPAWRATLEFLPLLLLLWLFAGEADRAALERALRGGWLLAATAVALLVVQQRWRPALLDLGFAADGKLAGFATMGNPIWSAIVLVGALPLAVARARHGGARLAWALPALLLGGLFATEARQAWLAVLVMAGGGLLLTIETPRRRMWLSAGLALSAAAAVWLLPDPLFHSLRGRLLIAAGAFDLMRESPWTGVGLGQLGAAYPAAQARLLATPFWADFTDNAAVIADAHNEFLHWGASTGIGGLGGFTLLCVGVAWLGARRALAEPALRPWLVAYGGVLVTLLFTGIQPHSALVLLVFSQQGVLLGGSAAPTSPPPTAARRAAGAVTLTAWAIAAGLWATADLRAGWFEGQGDRLMQERDPWLARDAYAEALAIDPPRADALRKLASLDYLDGRPREALAALTMAESLSGDTAIPLLRGEILATLGRDAEAIAVYRAVVASFPDLLTPRFVLGQLYLRQGQREAARHELQRVVAGAPSAHNNRQTREKIAAQKAMAASLLRAMEARP